MRPKRKPSGSTDIEPAVIVPLTVLFEVLRSGILTKSNTVAVTFTRCHSNRSVTYHNPLNQYPFLEGEKNNLRSHFPGKPFSWQRGDSVNSRLDPGMSQGWRNCTQPSTQPSRITPCHIRLRRQHKGRVSAEPTWRRDLATLEPCLLLFVGPWLNDCTGRIFCSPICKARKITGELTSMDGTVIIHNGVTRTRQLTGQFTAALVFSDRLKDSAINASRSGSSTIYSSSA